MAIEETCRHVLKRSIRDLFIADILQKSDSKSHLQLAEAAISEMRYLDALIETRKAIFVEFEEDYNIYDWHDYDGITQEGLMSMLRRGGWRAPSWTKSQDWIEKNVRVPTDFIQIDYEKLRLQALEMGIHTVELQNLQSLTPKVFRIKKESGWSVTYAASFPSSNANETNARYCLDRAVWTILKKQEHAGARREPAKDVPFDPPPMYLHRVVFEKPSTKSKQIHAISEGFTYYSHRIVGGFDPSETFLEISAESNQQSDKTLLGGAESFYKGFLQKMPEDG